MTAFDLARFLHITAAILWLGGGIALALGAEFARHKRGPASMLSIVGVVALMGPSYFVPVSLATLITGAVAAWIGPGFSELWVILGLAGAAATFLIGLLVIKPRTEEIANLIEGRNVDQEILLDRTRNLFGVVRFDHLILLLVVACMTLKPSHSDTRILVGMGSILLLGLVATVASVRSRGQAIP